MDQGTQKLRDGLDQAFFSADAALQTMTAVFNGTVPADQVVHAHANLVRAAQQVALLTDPTSGDLLVPPRS